MTKLIFTLISFLLFINICISALPDVKGKYFKATTKIETPLLISENINSNNFNANNIVGSLARINAIESNTTNANGFYGTQSNIGNIQTAGNTIISTNVNGNISITPNGSGSIISSGIQQYRTDQYLTEDVFPNTTTLYGWQAPSTNSNWSGVYGGVNLTLTGTLTTATDHLGNTKALVFDGTNDYLYGANDWKAVLDNGVWSMGAWVYQADWTTPDDGAIIGSVTASSGGEGVALMIDGTLKTMVLRTWNSTTAVDVLSVDLTVLSTGWHHFAVSRAGAASHAMYVDGLLLSSTTTTGTIDTTTTRYLSIGALEPGGGAFTIFAGDIQDAWVHIDTAWTPEQVKKIYARGSKLFATVKPDTNININLPLEGKWFNWKFTATTTGSMTFTSQNINYAKYKVEKNTACYALMISGTVGGTPSVGIIAYVPITAKDVTGEYAMAGKILTNGGYLGANVWIDDPFIIHYISSAAAYTAGATNVSSSGCYDWQ